MTNPELVLQGEYSVDPSCCGVCKDFARKEREQACVDLGICPRCEGRGVVAIAFRDGSPAVFTNCLRCGGRG